MIGPFTPFTAIVGPNGSGKSNLVDALCFGLCLPIKKQAMHVRDLVYKSAEGY